jgi:hypothetical protein
VPRSGLNNPNRFNQDFVYDETNNWYDYNNELLNSAKKIFEDTGMQVYYIGMIVPDGVTTEPQMISYMKQYIANNIDDAYGIYILRSSYASYDSDWSVYIYNKVIYGDYAQDFMDSTASKIYSAAYNKYYNAYGMYYSSDECIIMGHELMADRLIHPFKCLFFAGVRYFLIACACVVLVLIIKRVNRKHRSIEILETPMKDLVAEHAEEIKDRYE